MAAIQNWKEKDQQSFIPFRKEGLGHTPRWATQPWCKGSWGQGDLECIVEAQLQPEIICSNGASNSSD